MGQPPPPLPHHLDLRSDTLNGIHKLEKFEIRSKPQAGPIAA